MNIQKHIKSGYNSESIINIYADNTYVIVENSKSNVNENELNNIKLSLKKDNIPLKSISLYIANKFCNNMCKDIRENKNLQIEMKEDDIFIVKLPIIKYST